jgi:hypothetical protein
MTPSEIEPTNFRLVAKRNKTAIIFLPPINWTPINHLFDINQSEIVAVSIYKTQITNPYVHLPSPKTVILHKAMCSS